MPRWAMPRWTMPRPLDALLMRLPWYARRRQRFSRGEVLGAVPFRNPLVEWDVVQPPESQEGESAERKKSKAIRLVSLRVPRRRDWLGKIMTRVVAGPAYKRVELDEIGSQVWELCDGERNVDGLTQEMVRRHKLSRLEAETSLTAFLRTLTRRGFIGLKQGEPVQPAKRGRRRRRARRK